MERITFYSTNNKTEKANFRQAFMNAWLPITVFICSGGTVCPNWTWTPSWAMKELNYAGIAYKVLARFTGRHQSGRPEKNIKFGLR